MPPPSSTEIPAAGTLLPAAAQHNRNSPAPPMTANKAFAVDLPVTDLDEQVDDFHVHNEEVDEDFARHMADLQNLEFGSAPSRASRLWSKLSHAVFPKTSRKAGYSTIWPSSASTYSNPGDMDMDIELSNRNMHGIDSHGNSDFDFDYFTPKPMPPWKKIWHYVSAVLQSKLLMLPMLIVIVALSVTLVVVTAKHHHGKQIQSPYTEAAFSSKIEEGELDSSAPLDEPGNSMQASPADDMSSSVETSHQNRLTIVVSVAALHPHFISFENMAFVASLLNSSDTIYAPYMVPSNPSSKFPNLWTLSTGLYPAYNGIVDNTFYDGASSSEFHLSDKNPMWWLGEPVWQTAKRNHLNVTSFNWPAVELFGNDKPEHYLTFHKQSELNEQLNQIERYLSDPKEDLDLLLLHVDSLDRVVQSSGLAGDVLRKELYEIDDFIQRLYQTLQDYNILESSNIILVSEGGYAPVEKERTIDLASVVDVAKVERVEDSTIIGLYPAADVIIDELMDEIKAKLQDYATGDNFQVYKSKDVETEIYGGSSDRIAPIVIIPKPGYFIEHENNKMKKYISGYLNDEVLSRSVFLATGPYFRSTINDGNRVLEPFENVNVYNIICESLEINPSSNNGTDAMLHSAANFVEPEWSDGKAYPDVDFAMDTLEEQSFIEVQFPSVEVHKDEKEDTVPAHDEDVEEEVGEHEEPPHEELGLPQTEPEEHKDQSEEQSDTEHKEGSDYSDGDDDDDGKNGEDDNEEEEEDDDDDYGDHRSTLSKWWEDLQDHVEDLVDDVKDFIDDKLDD